MQQIGVKYYDEFNVGIPRPEVEAIRDVVLRHARAVRAVDEPEWDGPADVVATYKSMGCMGGTWKDGPCDRTGSVGGCKGYDASLKLTTINWEFAPQTTAHGSLVDVYGCGLLFTGRSAIGKSETALDLVERGHRLVADDVVTITRRHGDVLIGTGNQLLRHHMEIRGLGIIDVQAIFGIRAIRLQKRVELEVRLAEWSDDAEYERVGLDERKTEILGVQVPLVLVPITPGKNITVIAEVIALNYLVKVYGGYSPAERLNQHLIELMKRKSAARAWVREDTE